MSPSVEDATHYRFDETVWEDRYYKVGLETVYRWEERTKGWVQCYYAPHQVLKLRGITELRKPVVNPVVEAQDRQGRTWIISNPSNWTTGTAPEELQPIVEYPVVEDHQSSGTPVSEEHGCTEEEVEEAFKENEHMDAVKDWWSTVEYETFDNPNDKQVGGDHYKEMSLQPWEVVDHWGTKEQAIGYYLFSAVAYIGRYNSEGEGKGGLKDIQKAKHYLEKLESILLETE